MGHVECMGDLKNVYKSHLAGPRHRWEETIKTDLQEVGCEGLD
jgi:hypothetical protein